MTIDGDRMLDGENESVNAAEPASLPVRPGEEPWTPDEVSQVRGILLEDVATLSAEIADAEEVLAELLTDNRSSPTQDPADAGGKTSEREQEMTLAGAARSALGQAQHALARLDAGSYGTCESCGEPIGKGRLQAFPRATLCVSCKQRQERH